MKYRVTCEIPVTYEVEADSEDEAEEMALARLDEASDFDTSWATVSLVEEL